MGQKIAGADEKLQCQNDPRTHGKYSAIPDPHRVCQCGTYRPDEGAIWTRIQRAAEPFFDVDDQLFAREFKRDFGALEERSFYLTTDAGEEIGTITAWWQPDLNGQDWGQISLGCDSPGLSGARACQADDVRGDGIPQAIPRAQFFSAPQAGGFPPSKCISISDFIQTLSERIANRLGRKSRPFWNIRF